MTATNPLITIPDEENNNKNKEENGRKSIRTNYNIERPSLMSWLSWLNNSNDDENDEDEEEDEDDVQARKASYYYYLQSQDYADDAMVKIIFGDDFHPPTFHHHSYDEDNSIYRFEDEATTEGLDESFETDTTNDDPEGNLRDSLIVNHTSLLGTKEQQALLADVMKHGSSGKSQRRNSR